MVKFMKKNNKYRSSNNYNNQIYSLNYKFDSISPAGKISGTALDLIKRYNELAKEAQGNADYVEAENYRQYAEHYRKIVTEINERKNQRNNYQNKDENINSDNNIEAPSSETDKTVALPEIDVLEATPANTEEKAPKSVSKRQFKIIEISAADAEKPISASKTRTRTSRKVKEEAVAQ
ncbi:MAG: DUF4167 domain-containing protein [Alphaproteobacteria bacterium]|nr:DUF4167 domain-containing protein [Alphaproteobacteria bacterium]